MDPRTTPRRLTSLPSWLLNQVSIQAHRAVADRMKAAHIAHRYHYSLLAALEESGPASQAELGRRIGLDRSDVTAAINDLAQQGFVERTADETDRRRNVVSLTRVGLAHLGAMDELVAQAQEDLLAPLSAQERGELIRMLDVLHRHHLHHLAASREPEEEAKR